MVLLDVVIATLTHSEVLAAPVLAAERMAAQVVRVATTIQIHVRVPANQAVKALAAVMVRDRTDSGREIMVDPEGAMRAVFRAIRVVQVVLVVPGQQVPTGLVAPSMRELAMDKSAVAFYTLIREILVVPD
jgi:hypothetical protein